MTATNAPASNRMDPWLGCGAVMTALAIYTWSLATADLAAYTLPWLAHIRATGPVAAFSQPFANYSPPYLYLLALVAPLADNLGGQSTIKLLSFAGHVLLALSGRSLLRSVGHPQPDKAAWLLVAPSLLINPAILIQCDAFWAAALIMALAAAIERRNAAMFAWCGLAFAFKAQAAFAGPFFVAIALAQRARWSDWLAAPAAFVIALLPAWAAGWNAPDLAAIYLHQAGWSNALALNAPNIWSMVQALPGVADTSGLSALATVAAVAASLAYILYYRKHLVGADPGEIVRAACLAALLIPGLLPRMHERYFFLGEALAILLALLDPRWLRLALIVQLGATLGILAYLSGVSTLAILGAVPMILATAMLLPGKRGSTTGPVDRAVAVPSQPRFG